MNILSVILFSLFSFFSINADEGKIAVLVDRMLEEAQRNVYIIKNYDDLLSKVNNVERDLPTGSKEKYISEADNDLRVVLAIEAYFQFKPEFYISKDNFQKCRDLLNSKKVSDRSKIAACKDPANINGLVTQLNKIKAFLSAFNTNKDSTRKMIDGLRDGTDLKRDARRLFNTINHL